MRLPIQIDRLRPGTFRRQLEDQLRDLISRGFLQPGDRLPSTRMLGEDLGIARRTVTQAYEGLVAEGILESRNSVGTFVQSRRESDGETVREQMIDSASRWPGRILDLVSPGLYIPPGRHFAYDLRLGRPDGSAFPSRNWRKLLLEHLDTTRRAMSDYGDPAGAHSLREALCRDVLAGRGIIARPEDIVVVGGTQDGLNLLGRLFQIQGRPVAIENPCYEGAALAFQGLGAHLVGVPVDREGVRADMLPPRGARFLYTTPSHHFPLGMTMSRDRRLDVVRWAERTGSIIVEDDYDSDVQYERAMPAIKALAPEWVVYVGSFSKSMGPGLRLGYIVLPPGLASAARRMKAVMSNGQPWMEQMLLGEFIARGLFDRHRRDMKVRYAARRDALVGGLAQAVPGSHFEGLGSGMHVAWHLPRNMPAADEIRQACVAEDVGIYTLSASPCYLLQKVQNQAEILLCGYASLSPDKIFRAVDRISRVVHRLRERAEV